MLGLVLKLNGILSNNIDLLAEVTYTATSFLTTGGFTVEIMSFSVWQANSDKLQKNEAAMINNLHI
jgi:hypothetical protein